MFGSGRSLRRRAGWWFATLLAPLLAASVALAHGVAQGDKGYIQEVSGPHLVPFAYLGAKHMATGYDHLLFLFGVVFFLYRLKDVSIYVSLFAIGHSSTMLLGVYFGWDVSAAGDVDGDRLGQKDMLARIDSGL